MLDDKDRIFTNLYGFQDWGLKAAQARGDWDDTKALMAVGQDADHRRDQEQRPSRPRRRRLPDRHEMVVHAQGADARAGPISWSSTPTNPSPDRARTARSSATIRTN